MEGFLLSRSVRRLFSMVVLLLFVIGAVAETVAAPLRGVDVSPASQNGEMELVGRTVASTSSGVAEKAEETIIEEDAKQAVEMEEGLERPEKFVEEEGSSSGAATEVESEADVKSRLWQRVSSSRWIEVGDLFDAGAGGDQMVNDAIKKYVMSVVEAVVPEDIDELESVVTSVDSRSEPDEVDAATRSPFVEKESIEAVGKVEESVEIEEAEVFSDDDDSAPFAEGAGAVAEFVDVPAEHLEKVVEKLEGKKGEETVEAVKDVVEMIGAAAEVETIVKADEEKNVNRKSSEEIEKVAEEIIEDFVESVVTSVMKLVAGNNDGAEQVESLGGSTPFEEEDDVTKVGEAESLEVTFEAEETGKVYTEEEVKGKVPEAARKVDVIDNSKVEKKVEDEEVVVENSSEAVVIPVGSIWVDQGSVKDRQEVVFSTEGFAEGETFSTDEVYSGAEVYRGAQPFSANAEVFSTEEVRLPTVSAIEESPSEIVEDVAEADAVESVEAMAAEATNVVKPAQTVVLQRRNLRALEGMRDSSGSSYHVHIDPLGLLNRGNLLNRHSSEDEDYHHSYDDDYHKDDHVSSKNNMQHDDYDHGNDTSEDHSNGGRTTVVINTGNPSIKHSRKQPTCSSSSHTDCRPFHSSSTNTRISLSVPLGQDCLECDVDYFGKDVKKIENGVRDVKECQRMCQGHGMCDFFTYVEKWGGCYLKHSRMGRVTETTKILVSGPKYCSGRGSMQCHGQRVSWS